MGEIIIWSPAEIVSSLTYINKESLILWQYDVTGEKLSTKNPRGKKTPYIKGMN